MAATQQGRLLTLKTPLGADVLRALSFRAEESVSELFRFTVQAEANATVTVKPEDLLGQSLTVIVSAPGGTTPVRFFNGLCRSVRQGESTADVTAYELEIVPAVWKLTKKTQSRIFQQLTITDILKKVLAGFDVKYEYQTKGMEPRDYCVQYRESDWDFASRLMEEEGIFYFFKFADGAHTLVLTSHGQAPDVPPPTSITYKNVAQGPSQEEEYVYQWSKRQELISGKVTLWDHCFENPGDNYESKANVPVTLQVGEVTHKLNVANDTLEVYDYPGRFTSRFDGVDPGGGARAGDIAKMKPDGMRTAGIRAHEESATAVVASGMSTCANLTPGHKFTLKTISDDPLTKQLKAPGSYMVLSVTHAAEAQDEYRSGGGRKGFSYVNEFTVVPAAAAYRPPLKTYVPTVYGCQTATVVGPAGEEIFTDKYGRIKVQFHWDREGKKDANASCWIRVGTPWAGRGWGMFHLPRIGQEVIVDFLEGDPDQPIVVGSVYNAHQMPAYAQPDHKTKSWIKSNSSLGGEGFNEIRFEDLKGSEQIFIHGQKNLDIRILNDCMEYILHDRHLIVGLEKDGKKQGSQFEEVFVDRHLKVHKNHVEVIGGDMKLLVGGVDGDGNVDVVICKDRKEHIKGNTDLKIVGNHTVEVGGAVGVTFKADSATKIGGVQSLTVAKDSKTKIGGAAGWNVSKDVAFKSGAGFSFEAATDVAGKGMNVAFEAGNAMHLKAASGLVIECAAGITLKCGGNFICVTPAGVDIQGSLVKINSGGAPSSGAGCSPVAPTDPDEPAAVQEAAKAAPTAPRMADDSKTGHKSCS